MTARDRFVGALRQMNLPEDRIRIMLSDVSDRISPEGLDESYAILTDFLSVMRRLERRHYEAIPLIQIMSLNMLSALDKTNRAKLMVELIQFFFQQDTGIDIKQVWDDSIKQSREPAPLRGYV
jgi:hypothetical protein